MSSAPIPGDTRHLLDLGVSSDPPPWFLENCVRTPEESRRFEPRLRVSEDSTSIRTSQEAHPIVSGSDIYEINKSVYEGLLRLARPVPLMSNSQGWSDVARDERMEFVENRVLLKLPGTITNGSAFFEAVLDRFARDIGVGLIRLRTEDLIELALAVLPAGLRPEMDADACLKIFLGDNANDLSEPNDESRVDESSDDQIRDEETQDSAKAKLREDARLLLSRLVHLVLDAVASKAMYNHEILVSNNDPHPFILHIAGARLFADFDFTRAYLSLLGSLKVHVEGEDQLSRRVLLVATSDTWQRPKTYSSTETDDGMTCYHCHCSNNLDEVVAGILKVSEDNGNALSIAPVSSQSSRTLMKIDERKGVMRRNIRHLRYQTTQMPNVNRKLDLLRPYYEWRIDETYDVDWLQNRLLPPKEACHIAKIIARDLNEDRIGQVLHQMGRAREALSRWGVTDDFGLRDRWLNFSSHIQEVLKLIQEDSQYKQERKLLEVIVDPHDMQDTLQDIELPSAVERTILSLTKTMQSAVTGRYGLLKSNKVKGALLYGPPGTGKTHLARILAKQSKATLLLVSSADMESKWVGDTEKAIQSLFSLARMVAPSIVFIDEADALFRARTKDDRSWERSRINQLLAETDGFKRQTSQPFLLLATNNPRQLDVAVLRRVPLLIHMGLPSQEARARIFELILRDEVVNEDVNPRDLARSTSKFSGSDIHNLCVRAAMICQNELDDNGTGASTRQLHMIHFMEAMVNCGPTVSEAATREIADFSREYNPSALSTAEDNDEDQHHTRALSNDPVNETIVPNPADAIETARQALKATPTGHPDASRHLAELGHLLYHEYTRIGVPEDLDEAISSIRQALEAKLPGFNQVGFLDCLANCLSARSRRTGSTDDLNEAVDISEKLVDATQNDRCRQAGLLTNLSLFYSHRFERTGVVEDIEISVMASRRALYATSPNDATWATSMHRLGESLLRKFDATGNIAALEESIHATRQSIEAAPQTHPDWAAYVCELAFGLNRKFKTHKDIADLEEAIEKADQAVNAAQSGPHLALSLFVLRESLLLRFERFRDTKDLERALEVARKAVDFTPKYHTARAEYLDNLANLLHRKYESTGSTIDLEEALERSRQAVEATPKGHLASARRLDNLGNHLVVRYEITGSMTDLESSVLRSRQALAVLPEAHADRAEYLHNLGIRLEVRFGRTGSKADLEEATLMMRQALEAAPEGHPSRASRLNSLGAHLGLRFSELGAVSDLEESIDVVRQAIKATPQHHPLWAVSVFNLGNRLGVRSHENKTTENSDLDEAIISLQQAVEAISHENPRKAAYLHTLGSYLARRHKKTESIWDIDEANQCFLAALQLETAPIPTRIQSAHSLLLHRRVQKDSVDGFRAAEIAIDLIPRLAPQFLSLKEKQHTLLEAAFLASEAAAIALNAGKTPALATSWLETGRGVLTSTVQQLRTDFAELRHRHPSLASKFEEYRNILDSPVIDGVLMSDNDSNWASRLQTDRHSVSQSLMKTLEDIRRLEGLDRFLLPPSEDELLRSADRGPIIIVNVSGHRCDALIVRHHGIEKLPLPEVSRDQVQEFRNQLAPTSPYLLSWLWDSIVGPVLDHLGFSQPLPDKKRRVWWIPTGPLVGFPLHAAGHHLDKGGKTALDCIVSSYATSIKEIAHIRRRKRQEPSLIRRDLVLVCMEDTPEMGHLKFANEEIQQLKKFAEPMKLSTKLPVCTKEAVLSALNDCEIFHFAGHGGTDQKEPLQSKLLLDDWKSGPFTVESLLEMNLQQKHPFLAYLSACGSGQILNNESLDEGIHLSSAFQLAGFRHVIGTLWDVEDSTCVSMAELTYNTLQELGLSDEAVSYALHSASKAQRDKWVEGVRSEQEEEVERNVKPRTPVDARGLLWVPYVHYGV